MLPEPVNSEASTAQIKDGVECTDHVVDALVELHNTEALTTGRRALTITPSMPRPFQGSLAAEYLAPDGASGAGQPLYSTATATAPEYVAPTGHACEPQPLYGSAAPE